MRDNFLSNEMTQKICFWDIVCTKKRKFYISVPIGLWHKKADHFTERYTLIILRDQKLSSFAAKPALLLGVNVENE